MRGRYFLVPPTRQPSELKDLHLVLGVLSAIVKILCIAVIHLILWFMANSQFPKASYFRAVKSHFRRGVRHASCVPSPFFPVKVNEDLSQASRIDFLHHNLLGTSTFICGSFKQGLSRDRGRLTHWAKQDKDCRTDPLTFTKTFRLQHTSSLGQDGPGMPEGVLGAVVPSCNFLCIRILPILNAGHICFLKSMMCLG